MGEGARGREREERDAAARTQEFSASLPHGCQQPSTWSPHHCLPCVRQETELCLRQRYSSVGPGRYNQQFNH